MKKLLNKITLLVIATFLMTSVLHSQTLTVTSTPTEVDQNGESVAGPTTFSVEVRDWPINRDIFIRIKTGTDPDGPGTTDWKRLNPNAFRITSATTTNAGPLVTASAVTLGNMVTVNGTALQGYNVDLEWSQWSLNGPDTPMSGDSVILGGAGFLVPGDFNNNSVVVLGASPMTYSPTAPVPQINLVSVLNSAVDGTAANPIASVERGATFPVQFTLNTDSEITKLTVSFNLVGFNAVGRNYDVPGTEVELTNIPSTGEVDQVFTANIPFPTDPTILEGGVTWTLDKSQDPTLRPGPQPEALRNDAGSNNTNYRFKFVLDGQTFTSSVANPYIDTVILEVTQNPLSIQDLQAINIDGFYNSATQSIDLSSANTIEEVYVYNISGQMVSSTTVNDRNTSIDLSTLSRGIYIARIDNGSGSAILKLAR